ncbi:hypothetical protein [uncultured Microbacterium sp.]|uniref:hypothetical protein n=1 Tax=uncultured Microbacterium sp. TaxID=191216 RepID=UPI0028D8957D|nr:hypothetical protein [uncultured Microbacterium sp.]
MVPEAQAQLALASGTMELAGLWVALVSALAAVAASVFAFLQAKAAIDARRDAVAAEGGATAASIAALAAQIEANRIARESRESAESRFQLELKRDRRALQADLTDWFRGLSRTAPEQAQRDEPRLRARIEEDAVAQGFGEILDAMRWARAMHDGTYARVNSDGITERQAHNLRVIVKRRFRQFVSTWVDDRAKGAALIHGYTRKGWGALLQEPGWTESSANSETGAVATVTALQPEDAWSSLPDEPPTVQSAR